MRQSCFAVLDKLNELCHRAAAQEHWRELWAKCPINNGPLTTEVAHAAQMELARTRSLLHELEAEGWVESKGSPGYITRWWINGFNAGPYLEPDGGNLYRVHGLLVTSGQFWRCAHGSTGFGENLKSIGCEECKKTVNDGGGEAK